MTRTFTLRRSAERVTPSACESLGDMLECQAAVTASPSFFDGATAATLYHLAADAFEAGAAASLGHNRAARYQSQALELRAKAVALEARAQS